MTVPVPKKKPALIAAASLVVLALFASGYCWWNTDLLGAESFCGGRLDRGDAQAALDSAGRLSQVRVQGDAQHAEFACTLQRTSRFIGGDEQRVTLGTADEQGAFPFTTSVWKDPGSRSYFTSGVTGAVSPGGGYVVLPKACWSKVGGLQGSQVVRAGDGGVAAVTATVEKGSADQPGLARLLTRAARQVAEKAGCATPALAAAPALAAPSAAHTTDVRNVCGVPGLALPKSVILVGRAEPDTEQVNHGSPRTWACDLHMAGPAKASVSFAATSDTSIVQAATSGTGTMRNLPDHHGVAGPDQAVLHCGGGDTYFAAHWSSTYEGALLDSVSHSAAAYTQAKNATFQNFLDATADAHRCPRVTLP
ncbi:hypothetical protein [Streptomyces sp. NBC_00083]|uniref:hypothetical protein n=1 Tax=Streptomyces sp. NBC_00083 TaxID=2975647 RepID=UPI00224D3B41|nr:hypothetical protein [Streptomyces sp. NBC_00083]MCX5382412.1 hypothetical protein [Streptomyces sp. NBC_00083]